MRKLVLAVCLSGCMGTSPSDGSGADATPRICPMPATMPDTGTLGALKAQLCNVSGSMGHAHWYRLSAVLPGSSMSDVQLELWDGRGAFAGTPVHTGTFTITGA